MQRFFQTKKTILVLLCCLVLGTLRFSAVAFSEHRDCSRILGITEAVVKGGEVFLGDILRLDDVNPSIRNQLRTASLGLAPQAGKTKTLSQAEILHKLEVFGITSGSYCLEIPEEVRIVRYSRILSFGEIEAAVIREFLPRLSWKKVHLEKLEVPDTVQLPEGNVAFSFEYSPKTDLARPFYLVVNISVDREMVRRLFLRTVLDIEDMVAVAARELAPANMIGPDDFRLEWKRLPTTLHPPVRDVNILEGKKPRTLISMGQILNEDLLMTVPLIKRGDTVTLVYQNENLRLTTQAKSLESGVRGGRIQVMNLDSKKILRVEVVDHSTARVVF